MDPSESFAGGNLSDQQNQKRQLQICGPRPSPLSVHKDSHKIKKPPKHPAPPPQHRDQAPPLYAAAREPVVIYAVSPKVVHTTTSEFMNVVQRLTGISSAVFLESRNGGDVSPAARLAATENASPRGGKEPAVGKDETVEIATAMEEAAEFSGYAPGILSPSPAMLPTASAGIFSQMTTTSHHGGLFSPGFFSPAGLMSPFLMYSPGHVSLAASPTFADVFSHIWDP